MDPTWGTCLEQSLCKMTPRRLKMKKRVLVKFWRKELEKSKNSKESWENSFLVRTFLKKLISRGSPEVTFCSWMKFQRAYGRWVSSKKGSKKNLIIPAADGQLGKTDMGLSDMDSGRFGYGFWACGWFHIRSWSGLQPQTKYIYKTCMKKTEKKNKTYIYIYIYIYKTCIKISKQSRNIPKLYIKLPITPP